jgi:hypothetical protein
MKNKVLLFGGTLVLAGVTGASADMTPIGPAGANAMPKDPAGHQRGNQLLWDQAFDDGSYAVVDQDFPDFGSFSTYLVDDFSTGGQTWSICEVRTYFTNRPGLGFWDPSIRTAKLNFYPKPVGSTIPVDATDLAPEYSVAVTLVNLGLYWGAYSNTTGVAELQGINGEYWVGLTPEAAFGTYGQEFHVGFTTGYGDAAAMRNPGGGFAFASGTGWQRDIIGGANIT